MRMKEDPLAAPCAAYADLHPALTLIESLMSQQTDSVAETGNLAEQLSRVASEVQPTAWTSKIEEARDNVDELAKLRVLYDEKALTFISVYLIWAVTRSGMMDGRMNISNAICELLIAHDEIEDRGDQAFIKPIMKARAIRAMELHRAEPTGRHSTLDFAPADYDQLVNLANDILVAAFNRLVEYLPDAKRGDLYTTDCVVHGKTYQSHLNNDVDLRSVRAVPFKDCVNSEHPESRKLAEMLGIVHDRMQQLWGIEGVLKGTQNGQINERQHAHRLVQFLHKDETTDAYHCGGSLDSQVDNQNSRRYEYECHRQRLEIEFKAFTLFLKEMLVTLESSLQEGVTLLADVSGDQRATIDKLQTVKIIMTNCLAADAALRRYVRFGKEIEQTLRNDLSRGAGNRCVESQFEDVRSNYRWNVEQMQRRAQEDDSSEQVE